MLTSIKGLVQWELPIASARLSQFDWFMGNILLTFVSREPVCNKNLTIMFRVFK
jgi:hypothetical protein